MEIDIGIVCALKLEAQGLHVAGNFTREPAAPWPFYRGSYKSLTIGVITCGIGKVLASAATQYLIDYASPKVMINWGCAGAIDPRVRIGEIVAAQWAVEYDYESRSPRRIAADNGLFELACSINGIKPGILATADRNVDSVKKKQCLWQEHQATACDWESAAVLRVAAANSIPALALRVISDMGDCRPGPEFNARANSIMAEAIPILLEYINNLHPVNVKSVLGS